MQSGSQARLPDFNNFVGWKVFAPVSQIYFIFFRNSKWPPYGAPPGFTYFGPKLAKIPFKIPDNGQILRRYIFIMWNASNN